MKVFIKIWWYLSIIVIFVIPILLDGFRILDYLADNYTTKEMVVKYYSYDSSAERKSITIEGVVDKERVYFSRFNEDIENLYSLYPLIFSENKKDFIINVLKFKHSHIVMLIDDNELIKWEKEKLWCGIYIFFSIVIIFINRLIVKK